MRKNAETWMGIRAVLRLYEKMLRKVCARHQLTGTEADVIGFLHNNPGKDTAADIVELRGLSKGAVSKAVDSLIRKSMLEKIPDKKDRRKQHLCLRSEAQSVREDIESVQEEFWDTVLEGFTAAELEGYEQFKMKLLKNIEQATERMKDNES